MPPERNRRKTAYRALTAFRSCMCQISVVRQIGGEVVSQASRSTETPGWCTIKIRRPLVGFATEEPVKILKAQSHGLLFERPGDAVLKRRNVVVLAEP